MVLFVILMVFVVLLVLIKKFCFNDDKQSSISINKKSSTSFTISNLMCLIEQVENSTTLSKEEKEYYLNQYKSELADLINKRDAIVSYTKEEWNCHHSQGMYTTSQNVNNGCHIDKAKNQKFNLQEKPQKNSFGDGEYRIYKYTSPNGLVYIGQTKQTDSARRAGGYGATKMGWAQRLWGWENLKYEVIETGLTKEEANHFEMYWINYYNSALCGYNTEHDDNRYDYSRAKVTIRSDIERRNPQTGQELDEFILFAYQKQIGFDTFITIPM